MSDTIRVEIKVSGEVQYGGVKYSTSTPQQKEQKPTEKK